MAFLPRSALCILQTSNSSILISSGMHEKFKRFLKQQISFYQAKSQHWAVCSRICNASVAPVRIPKGRCSSQLVFAQVQGGKFKVRAAVALIVSRTVPAVPIEPRTTTDVSLGVSPMSSADHTGATGEEPFGQLWLQLVFTYLSTADLFRFRGVSREGRSQVDDYFRRLSRLELSDTAKTHFNWQHFHLITRHNVSLRSLGLVNVSWIDEDAFIRFLRRQPRLQSVDLSRAYQISNVTLLTLAQHCPTIERLRLRHCSWLSEAAFLQLITQCSQLVEIDLSSCWNLTDHCIAVLFATHGSTLRRVTLAGLYSLTDDWTVAIHSRANCLTFLDMSSCWRMTDSAIENVRQVGCLEQIALFGCPQISLSGHRLLLESGIEEVNSPTSSR